jgi:hypothetical protein
MAVKKRTVSATTVPRPSTRSLAGVKAVKSIRTTEAVVKIRSKANTTDGINTDPAVGKRSRKTAAESPAIMTSTGKMAGKRSKTVRPKGRGLWEVEVEKTVDDAAVTPNSTIVETKEDATKVQAAAGLK